MAKSYSLQTAFNSGVLDTRLSARVDVKQYYNGMSEGTNVLCLPQGGITRRPGMEFIADAGEECRVVPFIFSNTQAYLFVFRNNAVDIYRDDVFKATVVTTYTTAELMELRFTQSADTMVIVHENHAPALLQRQGSDTSWTLTDVTFKYVPQYDFNDASSPTPTSEIQRLDFDDDWREGQTFIITVADIDSEELAYTTSTSNLATRIEQALNDMPNLVYGDLSVTVFDAANLIFEVTFSDGNADDWGEITLRPTSPFISQSGNPNCGTTTVQDGSPRKEDVWSSTRGWPKTVTFHEGRLYFGGSTLLPITIWGSRVNDFFNFDPGRTRDDQAINVTLDVDQFDEIRAVFSNRNLQIFTAGAEYYVPASPITPENVAVLRQTGFGSADVQPQVIDGATIYLQRTGRSLREYVFDFAEEAYLSQTASLLAPELLNDPVDMAVSVGTDNEDANYVYVVNTDGTMAVFNTLRSQNVAGWSKWETDGQILNICRLVDDIYFTVKRTINSVTEYYVEKANDGSYMDSSKLYTSPATDTLTGLSHLNGEECYVRADDSVMQNRTPSGGSITIERTATDSAEVGLFFRPTVKTMPIEKDIGPGYNLNAEKRIVNAMVYLEGTTDLKVQDVTIPFRSFDTNILDTAITPFTGKKEVYLMGWDKSAVLELTQDNPAPMTVLGLSLEMEFS